MLLRASPSIAVCVLALIFSSAAHAIPTGPVLKDLVAIPNWSGLDLEPSGVAFVPSLGVIVVVSDEGSVCTQFVGFRPPSGSSGPPDTPVNCTKLGISESIDLEAIFHLPPEATAGNPGRGSVAANDTVVLGVEHPPALIEFSVSRGAPTGRKWDLSEHVPSSKGSGMEGAAFVPLPDTLEPDTHGLVYASSQETGHLYVLRIDFSPGADDGAVEYVGHLVPRLPDGASDISAVTYWAGGFDVLFVLSDKEDTLLAATPTLAQQTWIDAGSHGMHQEGFDMWGPVDGVQGVYKAFIADDAGGMWLATLDWNGA